MSGIHADQERRAPAPATAVYATGARSETVGAEANSDAAIRPGDSAWFARFFPAPTESDHKYTRGVVTMVTGSEAYPGAALIGTEAAARCGVGMVRYWGPAEVARMVVARTPEVVPSPGRSQVFVAGSGWDASDDAGLADRFRSTIETLPETSPDAFFVVDASALPCIGTAAHTREDGQPDPSHLVLTPHAGEAAQMLARLADPAWTRERVETDPAAAATRLAEITGATVVLKGHTTVVTAPGAHSVQCVSPTTRLATAGTGDALAGIIGTALALNHERIEREPEESRRRALVVQVCAAAVSLHSAAAAHASGAGNVPILATDIARAIPATLAAASS